MTRMSMALGVALALTATAGCQTMTGRTLGQNIDDKKMTAEVKTKLTAEKLHNLTWVGVGTYNGVVYLNGRASTADQKTRAAEIASRVNGVTRVVNNIDVIPGGATASGTSSRPAAAASPSASPAGPGATFSARITDVDMATGTLTLQMDDGRTVDARLPATALQNVQKGDRITVSISR